MARATNGRRNLICGAIAAAALLVPLPAAVAQSREIAKSEITHALTKWTDDFNAAATSRICDLFSTELRHDYRGFPERGFDQICELLQRSLRDPGKRYSYALDIKEIIVSGDLAVVRLVWSLTVRPLGTGQAIVSHEPGMDVLRRQADGTWKIVRYIAYEE